MANTVTSPRYARGMDHALARHVFWLFTAAMLALAAIYPVYARIPGANPLS
jgi:hypothetical protein